MILHYVPRLFCICLAIFAVLNLALGVAVRLGTGKAVRFAEKLQPNAAANFLFLMRVFPSAAAAFVVMTFCVPSFLWFEPAVKSERVSYACIVLAILGFASCIAGIGRIVRIVGSLRCYRKIQGISQRSIRFERRIFPLSILESDAPVVALAGLTRPQFIVSRGVLNSLSPEQIDAALRHEYGHLTSYDNHKRLLLCVTPELWPFTRMHSSLENSWMRFAEWAADDAAIGAQPGRALSLADALVQIARLGAVPRLPFLHISLLENSEDFSARVERLIQPRKYPIPPRFRTPLQKIALPLVLISALGLLWPMALPVTYRLLEMLVR